MSYTFTIETKNEEHTHTLEDIMWTYLKNNTSSTELQKLLVSSDSSEHGCVPNIDHGLHMTYSTLSTRSLVMVTNIASFYNEIHNTKFYIDYTEIEHGVIDHVTKKYFDNIFVHWVKRILGLSDNYSIKYYHRAMKRIKDLSRD